MFNNRPSEKNHGRISVGDLPLVVLAYLVSVCGFSLYCLCISGNQGNRVLSCIQQEDRMYLGTVKTKRRTQIVSHARFCNLATMQGMSRPEIK